MARPRKRCWPRQVTRWVELKITRPAGLSAREAGSSRPACARQLQQNDRAPLGVSPKTVDNQVQSIYAKAGVRTRAGATLFAMEHGLLA